MRETQNMIRPLGDEEISDLFYHASTEELTARAGEVCLKVHGEGVLLRGLLEYSNYCVSNCLYCGIRRDNKNVNRYRIREDLLVEVAREGYERGIRTFVLQGGEDPLYPADRLAALVGRLKEVSRGEAAVTLSCGMLRENEYHLLKEAGADRYLLRFETSDPGLHTYLRDGKTLASRMEALEALKGAGFQRGSGFMVGLPGETPETRLNNILLAKKLNLDMVGIGPFIPHPDTPLGGPDPSARGSADFLEEAVRGVALLRLALPEAHIPATTAAGTLAADGREKMISAGANVLMPNLTPVEHKKDYLLYPGKICLDESGIQCIGCLSGRVMGLGRRLSFDRGDAPRLLSRGEVS